MKKARKDEKGTTNVLPIHVDPSTLPPPESERWPPYCRGELWNVDSARFYVGRCQLCVHSFQPPESRRRKDKMVGLPPTLLCTDHPDSPGELCEVMPTDTCRSFQGSRGGWTATELVKPGRDGPSPTPGAQSPVSQFEGEIRRIPLTQGLFATVDAADYEELSKYKWCATRRGRNVYAYGYIDGKSVSMHRFIMKAPKGSVVDHIRWGGVDNRRCNLRVCTEEQNHANRGPRGGSSRFVGVTRHKDKWQAGIGYHGEYLYLGLFDDEIEAAKVRDRKAYELHGPYAHLNFPEDYAH